MKNLFILILLSLSFNSSVFADSKLGPKSPLKDSHVVRDLKGRLIEAASDEEPLITLPEDSHIVRDKQGRVIEDAHEEVISPSRLGNSDRVVKDKNGKVIEAALDEAKAPTTCKELLFQKHDAAIRYNLIKGKSSEDEAKRVEIRKEFTKLRKDQMLNKDLSNCERMKAASPGKGPT